MTRKRHDRSSPVALVFVAFCAGIVFAWWLWAYGPPKPAVDENPHLAAVDETKAAATRAVNATLPAAASSPAAQPVATSGDIPHRRLRVPIEGGDIESWKGGFYERRGGRPHEAVDILAPRNTPVYAVDAGRIEKLFLSKAGGNTIYQFDPDGRLCYYYAHLERYADGIREGQTVSQGQLIGYVGTSGNAPANTPHLHFAVFELNADRHWWQGRALDPYEVFRLSRNPSE
jgi:murein DD-endopeptidase MepM/ murein hydrolase activator NlpD